MDSMNSTRRLIVTGAHGFVAGSVIAQAGAAWEVHAVSRGRALLERDGVCWHQIDPLQPEALAELFRDVRPHAAIHAAAIADIDFCQANRSIARQVNVE